MSSSSDFLLLKLNATPALLTSYNATFAGWETNNANALNSNFTVGIHHHNGDIKKISRDNDPPLSINAPTINGINTGAALSHWQVSWNKGITAGGSSGSPLFNSDHKIIGQLHAGDSYCEFQNDPDYYGKFSVSYSLGFFSKWLDPYHSGTTSIGAYNPSGKNEHCYNKVKDGNETGIDCGGDCPPCDWVADNWGADPCYNGVRDNGETGIDCGGICRPCGGFIQCNNCDIDGDETSIDCGGSCPPCNNGCTYKNFTLDDIFVYVNFDGPHLLNEMPCIVRVQEDIETSPNNYPIHMTYTSYLPTPNLSLFAGNKIVLKPKIWIEKGCIFKASIASCICRQPCAIIMTDRFSPNGDGINDEWCCYAVGYNRYEVRIVDRNNNLVYNSTGSITDGIACIWNGRNNSGRPWGSGAYYAFVKFFSDCNGKSKEINLTVSVFASSNNAPPKDIEYTEYFEEDNDYSVGNMKIYPNPASNYLTIKYPNSSNNALIYIINESGKVVYATTSSQMNNNIDVNNLVQGTYIVKVVDSDNVYIEKFIKK
ncbi:MAG: T9SS type A sorting domain-containing protein [Prevotellaceae bacterium]|nr:T9SS type A sorting domain-containing protein [Prevotellaceae bacterium]